MEDEIGSLAPWQIFSALYLGFWAVSAYFDHFLMSFVFCIAFGVVSEIATKYMYGEQISHTKKDEVSSLVSMAKTEANLVPSLTQMAKVEASRSVDEDEEAATAGLINASGEDGVEEVEFDDGFDEDAGDSEPPPLPVKDYLSETPDTMEAVKNRLSQVMEASNLPETETNATSAEDDLCSDVDAKSAGYRCNQPGDLNDEVIKHVSEGYCPVMSELNLQDNNPTENIRSMSEISKSPAFSDESGTVESTAANREINLFSTRVQEDDPDDMFVENDVTESDVKYVENNIMRGGGTGPGDFNASADPRQEEKKIYAPDSSSEEELDEEYAKRDVNLDESESEEEEEEISKEPVGEPSNITNKDVKNEAATEKAPAELVRDSDSDLIGDLRGPDDNAEQKVEATDLKGIYGAKAALETSAPTADEHSTNTTEDFSDLDLTDPKLEEAATKIQSVFKGFQARKKIGKV